MATVIVQGCEVLIDDDILEEVSKRTWHMLDTGYAATNRSHKWTDPGPKKHGKLRMHHMVIGFPPEGAEVEHLNGNKLDNRRENLAFVDHWTNCARYNNKTKGYYFCRTRQKFMVCLMVHGHKVNGGRFDLEADAAQAAKDLRFKMQAEKAV